MLSKLYDCPNCGHKLIWMNRTYFGKYFAECSKCHYAGKTRSFRFLAIHSWNKECRKKYSSEAM